MDLIFKNGEPQKAVPGGSVFNALVSAKHAGADVLFVSETGKDKVGRIVLDFLKENGISTDYIYLYDEVNTPVSMAFLNDRNDAESVFYKPRPQCCRAVTRCFSARFIRSAPTLAHAWFRCSASRRKLIA